MARKKLTPEQKKIVWSGPKTNLGAGWTSQYSEPVDPRILEEKGIIKPTLPLDKIR